MKDVHAMIEIRDMQVRFGRTQVLESLSFTLEAGESLALWGVNGAGKTTALRALLGLLPFRGEARVAGADVRRDGRAARAAIGYVPQQLAFWDDLGTLALLRFLASLRGGVAAGRPAELLARVGLAEHERKQVGALSGGMRQRLALAAALLDDPPILVLDEPTASLDAAARRDFTALLTEQRTAGKTLLLTSHRIEEVRALADRVIVLEDGQVRHDGDVHTLAEALRPSETLRLAIGAARIDEALALLDAGGFQVRRNGHGVLVDVTPGKRAAPVTALLAAGVPLEDLSLEARHGEGEGE
jgi:ABC-type multidrug transport system ATPase subunit